MIQLTNEQASAVFAALKMVRNAGEIYERCEPHKHSIGGIKTRRDLWLLNGSTDDFHHARDIMQDKIENASDDTNQRISELEAAIRAFIAENKHLADGDNCTLAGLKQVIGGDDD